MDVQNYCKLNNQLQKWSLFAKHQRLAIMKYLYGMTEGVLINVKSLVYCFKKKLFSSFFGEISVFQLFINQCAKQFLRK